MPATRRFTITMLFVLFCFAFTQGQTQTTTVPSGLTVTAAATDERVRITAPSSVVQLHVEVYAISGEKVADQEIKGGNVFDWHLQNGQAERLAPGSYVCVITAKSTSGKLTQKIGTVTVEEKSVSVQAGESAKLSTMQAQAIGPMEENSSWTIAGKDEPQTTTVIANDGNDGQMIRGRGALTFRIGNFFSGVDKEQMRLTEAGDLGIGTAEPQAKLDVAGTIRAERFLIAKPKTANTTGQTGDTAQAANAADSFQPLVAGNGTWNHLVRWMDDTGTLGDSAITQSSGNLGIGTTTPAAKLEIVTAADTQANIKANKSSNALAFGSPYTPGADSYAPGLVWNASVISELHPSAGIFAQFTGAGSYLHFGTTNTYAGLTNDMVIDPQGNVGIGTTNPNRTLTVHGDAGLNVRSSASNYFVNLNYAYGSKIAALYSLSDVGAVANLSINPEGGNVGIGTTTPGFPLTVNGVIHSTTGGFRFPDGTTQKTAGALPGTGTLNMVPLWTGSATLGNSILVQLNGQIGIGTTTFGGPGNPTGGKLSVADAYNPIYANTFNGTAVLGWSTYGRGVMGQSDSGPGVWAESLLGPGLRVVSAGNLIEGTNIYGNRHLFHITNDGTYVTGSDFAESMPARGGKAGYEPGDVLVVSTKAPGKVEKASQPYDSHVAGIYSTRPGVLGADKNGTSRMDADEVPVALLGIVPTKVSAENGAIQVGDLLTTSRTPGYAMKASKPYRLGTILGKALEPLKQGKSVIKVLVTLR